MSNGLLVTYFKPVINNSNFSIQKPASQNPYPRNPKPTPHETTPHSFRCSYRSIYRL